MSLCDIANKYGTDKCPTHKGLRPGHSYTPFYETLFRAGGYAVKFVLEIGIERGASLRMWRDFFPQATVVGLDIVPENLIQEDRIFSLLINPVLSIEGLKPGGFNVIVDDGSHNPDDQIAAFLNLFPLLSTQGIYIIEDVQRGFVSYVRNSLKQPSLVFEFDKEFPSEDDRLIVVTK